ncbi:Outer membrane lipoprotein-sorting protein [Sphingomonas antarctica]|uniref:hypothetical protein n=1 Tax=Sphingomonas antarctica TaxID=2040274 RepID=UPI0039EAC514
MLAIIALSAAVAIAPLDAPAIFARATKAHGGEAWARAKTLTLSGHAIFYAPTGGTVASRADDYRMWRVYDPARSASHAAEGKVRIIAKSGQKQLFTVGYDGVMTWNDKGVVPKAEADTYWASNFGFGIIRHAADAGFKAERMPDDWVANHPLYMLRLTDPEGGVTLFGIDQATYAIRTMAFATPRGWHERIYDDFVRLKNPDWLQARHVTLRYNGVKQNEVFWTRTIVNAAIPESLFAAVKSP